MNSHRDLLAELTLTLSRRTLTVVVIAEDGDLECLICFTVNTTTLVVQPGCIAVSIHDLKAIKSIFKYKSYASKLGEI